MEKDTVLVTGVAGFIGFHLTKLILEKNDFNVIGIDNVNSYYDPKLKYGRLQELGINNADSTNDKSLNSSRYSNFTFQNIDISEKEKLFEIFENNRITHIVNLAAQAGVRYSIENPDVYIKSNIVGFANILEASRQFSIKHLVYASSSSVYGANKEIPFKESQKVDNPISLYAASKKSNELMAHTYSHLYNIPTTGLRFFTVYGPWGRPDMATFLFTNAILSNKPIKVFNYGNMKRDFTYVEDIVEGVYKVLENSPNQRKEKIPYALYNIGNSKPIDLLEFIKVLENKLGKEAKKEMLPLQDGDVYETYADVSALQNDFGYKPNTNIEDGIEQFVNWYKEHYKIKI